MAIDISASGTVGTSVSASLESTFQKKTPSELLRAELLRALPEVADRIFPAIAPKVFNNYVVYTMTNNDEENRTLSGAARMKITYAVTIVSTKYMTLEDMWFRTFRHLKSSRNFTMRGGGDELWSDYLKRYVRALVVEIEE